MLLTWKLRPMEGKGQPKARALDMVEPGWNLCLGGTSAVCPTRSFVLVLSCLFRLEASELLKGL